MLYIEAVTDIEDQNDGYRGLVSNVMRRKPDLMDIEVTYIEK